jgi:type IV secretion system protein VirB4
VLSRNPRGSTVLNVDLKALGPLLTVLGGGQAGLNAFGADYARRPEILEGMISQ